MAAVEGMQGLGEGLAAKRLTLLPVKRCPLAFSEKLDDAGIEFDAIVPGNFVLGPGFDQWSEIAFPLVRNLNGAGGEADQRGVQLFMLAISGRS